MSKVKRYSRCVNASQMHVRLNGTSLEEVECFNNLGAQGITNGESERDLVHIMSGYKAFGELKSALTYRGMWINA